MQPLTADGAPDETRVMLVEIYKDQAAFDTHRGGARMPSVAAGSKPLLDGRVLTVCRMDISA